VNPASWQREPVLPARVPVFTTGIGAGQHAIRDLADIMTKKIVLALIASGIVFSATACNTVRGAGEDVESAANAVDKAT